MIRWVACLWIGFLLLLLFVFNALEVTKFAPSAKFLTPLFYKLDLSWGTVGLQFFFSPNYSFIFALNSPGYPGYKEKYVWCGGDGSPFELNLWVNPSLPLPQSSVQPTLGGRVRRKINRPKATVSFHLIPSSSSSSSNLPMSKFVVWGTAHKQFVQF